MSYLIFCSFEVGGFPFRMAETLNRHGVETYYIYLGKRRSEHDSAEFHYGSRSPEWDLTNSFENILSDSKEVIRRLNQIKAKKNILNCLATGKRAYLLKMAGIEYMYWSYGSDIDQECFIRVPVSNRPLCKRMLIHPSRVFSEYRGARKSVRGAISVMISSYQLESLNRICPKSMFFLPHHFKVIDYQLLLQKKIQSKKIICEQIGARQYFFSATRQVWCGNLRDMTDNKGNDVILNSYAAFKKLTGDHYSGLVLVEKGPDVDASKVLSRSLNLHDSIAWVDEMKREELDPYYQGADICFGQFGTPALTYAALEPLANGTVSVSFSNKNNSTVPFYEEYPPIFSSKDPKEIAGFMAETLSKKENHAALSYESWLWIRDNCSEEKFVKSFVNLFGQSHHLKESKTE